MESVIDPASISRINDFSSTLTSILLTIEQRCRDVSQTNFLELKSLVDSHTETIKDLEKAKVEQNENLKDSLGVHANMGQNIVNIASNSFSELQAELMELRDTTKHELNAMQAALSRLITESIAQILAPAKEEVKWPEITPDSAPLEVMQMMMKRIELLEKKTSAQEITNSALLKCMGTDNGIQDRFDALAAKLRDAERTIERQSKLIMNENRNVQNIQAAQERVDKCIEILDNKLNHLTLNVGRRLSMFETLPGIDELKLPLMQPLIPLEESADEDSLEDADDFDIDINKDGGGSDNRMSEKDRESIVGRLKKEMIGRKSETKHIGSKITDEMLDFILEKLGSLEEGLNAQVAQKVEAVIESEQILNTRVQQITDNMTELEQHVESIRMIAPVADIDLNKEHEKQFNALTLEVKELWELVLTDVNRKVSNLDFVAKQLDKPPTEEHKQLMLFRDNVTHVVSRLNDKRGDAKDEVLSDMNDRLEALVKQAESVAYLEHEAQRRERLQPDYNGTIANKIPELLETAVKRTAKILNERIEKYDLRRKLEELNAKVEEKLNKSQFADVEEELREKLNSKADMKYVDHVGLKKANANDLQQVRERLFDEIDSIRSLVLMHNKTASNSNNELSSTELANVNNRFDMLYKQFQDLLRKTLSFVPREEIESALQALLDEIKNVSNSSVDKTTFAEKLKKKADNAEVDRLLSILSGSVGAPPGQASAFHIKCLVCDKPVNPFGASNFNNNRAHSPGETQWYDKSADEVNRPNTTLSPLRSNSQALHRPYTSGLDKMMSRTTSSPEKIRVSTEVNIVRNSVDSLPALPGAQMDHSNDQQSKSRLQSQSKRIRASAGGGMSTKIQKDTR